MANNSQVSNLTIDGVTYDLVDEVASHAHPQYVIGENIDIYPIQESTIMSGDYIDGNTKVITDSTVTDRTIWLYANPNTTYTIKCSASSTKRVGTYATLDYGVTTSHYDTVTGTGDMTVTSGADDRYLVIQLFISSDDNEILSDYLSSLQIIASGNIVTSINNQIGDVTLTYSNVGAAASSHAHGNITSGGDITATAPTIASGDQIVINDASASKITNGPTFDGATTKTALTPKGTWEDFVKKDGSYGDPVYSYSVYGLGSSSVEIPVYYSTQNITDSNQVTTKGYVDNAISALPSPMLFKGSVGTGGTITTLPAAAATNEGFTYKVITALSTPVVAKVGDTVISNGSSWIVIPSGDEPSGTVTSVGLSNASNGGLTISGSPITSSGSITVGHSNVLTSAQTTQAVYPIKIDKNGHISAYGSAVSIPTKVSDLTNDSGFITGYTETDPIFTASAAHGITSSNISTWNGKQDELVSGTNIKTINNTSILGSGNISVTTSGTSTPTADEVAKFDSTAHMDSTDMTASQVIAFVNGLTPTKSDIFIALINATTYQEVVDALQARRVVFAYTTNSQGTYNVYPYAHHNTNQIVFTRTHHNTSMGLQAKTVTLANDDTWTTITNNLEGSWTTSVDGSTGKLYFYRTGNVVYMSSDGAFRSNSTSISNGTRLTQTVPSGYRPVALSYISAVHNAANNWRLEFTTNGDITFMGSTAWNTNMWVSGIWITNDPIPT